MPGVGSRSSAFPATHLSQYLFTLLSKDWVRRRWRTFPCFGSCHGSRNTRESFAPTNLRRAKIPFLRCKRIRKNVDHHEHRMWNLNREIQLAERVLHILCTNICEKKPEVLRTWWKRLQWCKYQSSLHDFGRVRRLQGLIRCGCAFFHSHGIHHTDSVSPAGNNGFYSVTPTFFHSLQSRCCCCSKQNSNYFVLGSIGKSFSAL